jgi:hypothetical protein
MRAVGKREEFEVEEALAQAKRCERPPAGLLEDFGHRELAAQAPYFLRREALDAEVFAEAPLDLEPVLPVRFHRVDPAMLGEQGADAGEQDFVLTHARFEHIPFKRRFTGAHDLQPRTRARPSSRRARARA